MAQKGRNVNLGLFSYFRKERKQLFLLEKVKKKTPFSCLPVGKGRVYPKGESFGMSFFPLFPANCGVAVNLPPFVKGCVNPRGESLKMSVFRSFFLRIVALLSFCLSFLTGCVYPEGESLKMSVFHSFYL